MKTVSVRDTVFGEGLAKICIPVTARNMEELEQQLAGLTEEPWDLVEWRADFFEERLRKRTCEEKDTGWYMQPLRRIRDAAADRPLLFTFRTKQEGGEREISLEEYEQLNESVAASGLADLIDIEINRGEELFERLTEKVHAQNSLCGRGVCTVGSFHDFYTTLPRHKIVETLCRMQQLGADLTKAAVMPREERDVLTLLEAALDMKKQFADRPFITMSMGKMGAVSRICGTLSGSAVTFATAGRASAPGQLDARTVEGILKKLS